MEQAVPLAVDSSELPKVLVVEDESTSRRALTWLLAANGFQPVPFGSAEECALTGPEDALLAVLDVDLPGMSGLELAERLQERDPALRVIFVTAVEGERINEFRRDHPAGYIRKPVDFPELLRILGARRHSN